MARYSSGQAKAWARENMHGHWTTTITPFLPDGEVDEAGIAKHVANIAQLGTRGIGITWVTGEFWSLTVAERMRVAEITLQSAAGKTYVAVHTSHTSLKECIALTQHAQENGADFAVLMPPYIIARTLPQVYEFFKRVAAETDLGIMIGLKWLFPDTSVLSHLL